MHRRKDSAPADGCATARCPVMLPCRAGAGGSARRRKKASSWTTRNGLTKPWWSEAGWAWREERSAERPVYWQGKRDGVWLARRYRVDEELAPHAPVVFVNW